MPQVYQPSVHFWRKPISVATVVILLLGLFGGITFLVKPKQADAAVSQLPLAQGVAAFSGAGSNSDQESLAITQSTNSTSLIQSPETWIKIYLASTDVGSGSIQLYNMAHDCSASYTADLETPASSCTPGLVDSSDDQVMYDFYYTNADESINPAAKIFTIDGQTGRDASTGTQLVAAPGSRVDNWSGNVNIPLSSNGNSAVLSTHSNYYVVLMRARWGNCAAALDDCSNVLPPDGASTRLHAYLVRTVASQDLLGYWAQNAVVGNGQLPMFGSFTTHYMGSGLNFDIQNMEVDFAPPCTVTTPETATLRWKNGDVPWDTPNPGHDGDQPEWNDIANSFQLIQVAPNGSQQTIETLPGGSAFNRNANEIPLVPGNGNGTGTDIGGIQAYREVNFTAIPGDKYRWVWHNIDSPTQQNPPNGSIGNGHNVQMWLPYDSINYDFSCFNYSSTITPITGQPADGGILDLANPANQNVKFWINATNSGGNIGPVAHTAPVVTPGGFGSWDSTGPSDISRTIPGLTTLSQIGEFGFNIDPNTPDGTKLCFTDTITPHVGINDVYPSDNKVCYIIRNLRGYPAVVGENSDVHAGGGLCSGTQTDGSVIGNGNSISKDQYVVSASAVGGISNFGSNGATSAAAGNTLGVGSAGGITGEYTQVCRENLLAAAQSYYNANVAALSSSGKVIGTDLNLSGVTSDGAYFFPGPGTVTVHGTTSHKITLVALNGNVTFSGASVTIASGTFARQNLPLLGIIAGGDINIPAATTRVDAYLFATGNIDTCVEGLGSTTACNSNLRVNGFLMAHNILLHRLGPTGTNGASVTEDVVMNPQIYLNPPQFFDASVDGGTLQGQGEKPPLF